MGTYLTTYREADVIESGGVVGGSVRWVRKVRRRAVKGDFSK